MFITKYIKKIGIFYLFVIKILFLFEKLNKIFTL